MPWKSYLRNPNYQNFILTRKQKVQELVSYQKKASWLSDSISKPKQLISLHFPNKTLVCGPNALKVNDIMKFQTKSTVDGFRNYFSNLNSILLKKLLASPKNYVFNYAIQYYMHCFQGDASHLTNTTGIIKSKILIRQRTMPRGKRYC